GRGSSRAPGSRGARRDGRGCGGRAPGPSSTSAPRRTTTGVSVSSTFSGYLSRSHSRQRTPTPRDSWPSYETRRIGPWTSTAEPAGAEPGGWPRSCAMRSTAGRSSGRWRRRGRTARGRSWPRSTSRGSGGGPPATSPAAIVGGPGRPPGRRMACHPRRRYRNGGDSGSAGVRHAARVVNLPGSPVVQAWCDPRMGSGDETARAVDRAAETARLVRAARAGDREAFGRLVELHQRSVTRLAYRILGDRDDADGAAQEVFALRYYEDRSLAEIAALSRVSIGTVKTHLFRATRRIRKAVEALYGTRFPWS